MTAMQRSSITALGGGGSSPPPIPAPQTMPTQDDAAVQRAAQYDLAQKESQFSGPEQNRLAKGGRLGNADGALTLQPGVTGSNAPASVMSGTKTGTG